EPIGTVRASGPEGPARALAHALEVALGATRAAARAGRAERQLAALDQAIRGIGGVLDVDRVLQVIADRVRELVDARYAAIGIVDEHGAIERFITSGISDEERRAIGDLPRGRGLLGLIIREHRTYRIPEIGAHPESHGFPPNHPPMHSFLGTPITTKRATVGRLYLTDKVGAPEFSEHDAALVEMFARHAGIAIENARLHDQVRRLAVVDERDRISRDLHDSAIQAIYAQTLALDDVPDLIDDDPDEARRRVDEGIDALHAVIRDIRNFIFGLRPVLLESGSLAEGLEHLAMELRRNGGVAVEVAVDAPAEALDGLPLEVVAEILAVVREGLSNVARHAGATTTRIGLAAEDGELRLEMVDDGRGFRADERPERGHHGLANMRARTEALNGRFEVVSTPERGTRIIITLPRPRGGHDGGGNP
ncbi:MAG TPA: GAF domain-containing sensor histidine kinase, partial [Candidatus Angelobacter sp.]|nr:GAF domain-containing sensor histidine kinase [Candidatus Angelobacter sp.]